MTRRQCISRLSVALPGALPVGLALLSSAPMGAEPQPKDSMPDNDATSDNGVSDQAAQPPVQTPAQIKERLETAKIAVVAQRTFGLHLLRDIVDRSPAKNVFISPISIFLALHMAENGSAGATQAAMRKALELPAVDARALNISSATLQNLLKSQAPAALSIANALWADRHFTLAPDFVKLCQSVFGARAASLNFADPKSAAEINDWVKTNTKGKIPTIVTPDGVAKAALILTNAVYFAATWESEFSVAATHDEPFHKTGDGSKTVPMMHQVALRGAYRSGAGFEGAMLSYKNSAMFFYALLPQPGKTPKDVLASLRPDRLSDGPTEFDLDLKLPRFTLDFSASLADYLKRMGMDVAFHYPGADFLPMGSKELFISDVIHKTRLEVDEKGTVAAAATAVMMRAGSAMPQARPKKILVFDRPFVVLIGDSQTGAVLFAGVIEDP
jgi:serine protease inhibitor